MRTYHRILLLSVVILSINLVLQIWMLGQFLDVRQTVREYRSNWLPTLRQAGLLSRAIRELRSLELRTLLEADEAGLARAIRRMTRLELTIARHEETLRKLLSIKAEYDAFAVYRAAKEAYMADHGRTVEALRQGRRDQATELALSTSVQELATVFSALESMEIINQE